jgi:hypothetical protein
LRFGKKIMGDPLGRPCSPTNIYFCSQGQVMILALLKKFLQSPALHRFWKMAKPAPTGCLQDLPRMLPAFGTGTAAWTDVISEEKLWGEIIRSAP